ncbi:SF1B family DNA helicase RecD2 [Anaerotignum sp.]|uniref:SF1B family DNA helicase RecD2 n=1 Tax=Anaerotignum sp. TaxID=2039241 RepID=UPI0028B18391|nr:ATP-dependent RecD-like DNA helicase [Anaerotignum sp.]
MGYRCIYEQTVFYNPLNRFSVIRVKTDDTSVPQDARSTYKHKDHLIRFTATGFDLPQSDAVSLDLEGEWINGDKHGYQLQVEHCREIIPPTLDGVRGYLVSGLIKGIGEKTAACIVERFGVKSLQILEQSPEQLLEIKGITEERLEEIKASYAESRVMRDLMTFLSPFQVSPNTVTKIHQSLGVNSLTILQKNPFELCRFSGFGFKRVDEIAQKMGCRVDAPERIRGALFYMLDKKCNEQGHLFLEKAALCRTTMRLINGGIKQKEIRVQSEALDNQLQSMILSGHVVAYKDSIYSKRSFVLEDETARRITEILLEDAPEVDISLTLTQVCKQFSLRLSEKQILAVKTAFQHNLSIITGSPGTGKTTVLKAVLEVWKVLNPASKILLTAPTGRASRRISESTGMDGAKTLHSALGLVGGDVDNEYEDGDSIDADLVVVDETSMADMWLTAQLFYRLKPGTKLILVGDADQLPSVGPGNVFRELIACRLIPVTVLDQIFRQAKDSLIAYNAKFINENKTSLYYGNDFIFIDCDNEKETAEIIRQVYLEEVFQSCIEKVQILSPYRSDGEASAEQLGFAIREDINPCAPEIPELRVGAKTFRIGDRVMQTKNKGEISNGDLGFIRSFNHATSSDPATVTIEFSDARFVKYELNQMGSIKLAYAMTVHKAMGSEYDTVIMPVLAKHMVLLYRNLVYTAITRAKRRIFLVGEKDILFMAIHRCRIDDRNTMLGVRVTQYVKSLTLQARLNGSAQIEQMKLTG